MGKKRFVATFTHVLIFYLALCCAGAHRDAGTAVNPEPRRTALAREREEVSFAREIQPLFDTRCACHVDGPPAAGLDLKAGQAYGYLVNVRSSQVREMFYVHPGSPERSYLLYKLLGSQFDVGGGGLLMPADGTELSRWEIDTIRRWIAAGAPRN